MCFWILRFESYNCCILNEIFPSSSHDLMQVLILSSHLFDTCPFIEIFSCGNKDQEQTHASVFVRETTATISSIRKPKIVPLESSTPCSMITAHWAGSVKIKRLPSRFERMRMVPTHVRRRDTQRKAPNMVILLQLLRYKERINVVMCVEEQIIC